MTTRCRGGSARHGQSTQTKTTCLENRVLGQEWITNRSGADPLRRSFVDLQPRQAFVPAPQSSLPPRSDYSSKSYEAMILPQKTLPNMVWQAPVRSGKTAPTGLEEVDVVPREGSRPSRLAAKNGKSPLRGWRGRDFSRLESQPKSPADRRRPPRAIDCQSRKSKRFGRRRGVPLKLGRHFPLRWPLHRGPLDRRSGRGGRSRGRGSGSRQRAGTRPGSDLARLRNARRCRSSGSVADGRDWGRRRGRGGLGPFGASGKPTDGHGQGRRGHRTPQTTHVHRKRSSTSRFDGSATACGSIHDGPQHTPADGAGRQPAPRRGRLSPVNNCSKSLSRSRC